ncbi:hypothetical protein [Salipiger profundus]|uniref:hypothetical protein n=1 Tax=Salipiger profundus TaxID=1229727 RepID=UPI0008ECCC41|nr:hypothetical protein [Salipiger profundus]SFD73843.1 hypothetical protein SAMN05444415_1162 [Salipiger profundus]
MSTPDFRSSSGNEAPTTRQALEAQMQSVIDAFYEEIGGLVTGLLPTGTFDASSGQFPESSYHGTFYFVSVPGTVDGEAFAVGDWLVPLVDEASTTTFAGQWVRGDYSKIMPPVYRDVLSLSSSQEAARGPGAIWKTMNGFRYLEVASDAPEVDYHLTTAPPAPVKLAYQPDQEVNILALRSLEDGGDISRTMRRAAAAFPGKILRLPPGPYSAATPLELGDLDRSLIRAEGAHIRVEEDIPFVRVAPPEWEALQKIAPVEAKGYWGARKTITCQDGSAYKPGDLVKLVSDDKMASTRPGTRGEDYRMGFMAVVAEIRGNSLIFDRPLPPSWGLIRNPRVGRLPRRRLHWKGGVIGYESGHEKRWTGHAMILHGISDLQVEVEIEHAYNAAVRALGCFEPRITAVGRDLRNDQDNGQYGYLVSDGSQGANIKVMAGMNRHAYTTSQAAVEENSSSLLGYGPACLAQVTGQSHGNTQAGFDTHHGSAWISFNDCIVSGGTDGGGQFVFRGVGHRLVNGRGFNGKNGILIFSEKGVSSPTRDINIISSNIDVDDNALRVEHAHANIENCTFRSRKYANAVSIELGHLKIRGHTKIQPGGPSKKDRRRTIDVINGTLDARGAEIEVELSEVPRDAKNYGVVYVGGSFGSTLTGGTWRMINDTPLTAFLYSDRFTESHRIGGGGLKLITERNDIYPDGTIMELGSSRSGFTAAWKWRSEEGGASSGYIHSFVGTHGFSPQWLNRGDATVFWSLSSDGQYELGALPHGTFVGQKLMIACDSGELTLKNGAAFNSKLGGNHIVFSQGTGISLVWNGSVWLRVAM